MILPGCACRAGGPLPPAAAESPAAAELHWQDEPVFQLAPEQASAAARPGGGHHVTVVVADSGPGIGVADLERIFDAFEQPRLGAKVGGAGLGWRSGASSRA